MSRRAQCPVELPGGPWPGPLSADSRGRVRIQLGKGHPAANSGGWTWLPRYIAWRETGHVLRADEHVHHECRHSGALRCTDPAHFRVVTPEFHGRLHAYATLLWRVRDAKGRWVPGTAPLEIPDGEYPPYPVPRDRAVVTSGRTGSGSIP